MAAAGANEETRSRAADDAQDSEPQAPRREAGSPVFIVGVHRRCGSNFLAAVLRLCPELEGPAPLSEDYVLEHSPLLTQYVEQTAAEQYRKRFEEDGRYQQCKAAMLCRLGDGILEFLGGYIQPGKRLLTKTPDAFHLENFFPLFPQATLLILVRDGRDVVESSHRSWPSESYAHWMKAWARGAREILDFTHGPGRAWAGRWKLLRYEDLLGDRSALEEVLDFIAVDRDVFPWDQLDELPVRGSSVHRGGQRKLNWDPVQKPKDFKPVGRWEAWGRWRRRQFKRLAGRELIELGYVADNSW